MPMRRFVLMSVVMLTVGADCLRADLPVPFWQRGEQERRRRERWLNRHDTVPQMAAVPPANAWRVVVEVNPDATRPVLVVPRTAMARVPAREESAKRQGTVGVAVPAVHLLLALGLAGGGLYLLRGRVRVGFATALLLTVGAAGWANWSRVEANTPPPLDARYRDEFKAVRIGDVLLEDVRVETPDDGEVKLTLPPALLSRFRPDEKPR
jgi:hypothetical protein